MALTTDQSKGLFLLSSVICIVCLLIVMLTGTTVTVSALAFFFIFRFIARVAWPETVQQQYIYFKNKHNDYFGR